MGGRGMGKTRTGVEAVRSRVETGRAGRVGLIGATAADARDVMIEGESGILAMSPPWAKPVYQPSKRRMVWPNGAQAAVYSADEPDRLRGPQHDFVWGDEPSAWRYGEEALAMARFGLRLGTEPQMVLTMTPKSVRWLRDLLSLPEVVVYQGSMRENAANLASQFVETILSRYAGTRMGAQEIEGMLLGDVEGALWHELTIHAHRLDQIAHMPETDLCVVGVDPPGGLKTECGIVVTRRQAHPVDQRQPHAYVVEDASLAGSPEAWGARVVQAYREHRANIVVVERNFGGEMCRSTIHAVDSTVRVKMVNASVGKQPRAEPVAAQYEQGRVHHVGTFGALESEQTTWVPGEKSPNRMDALVWSLAHCIPPGAVSIAKVTHAEGAMSTAGATGSPLTNPLGTRGPGGRVESFR